MIILVPKSAELFTYEGNFEIISMDAANSNDFINVVYPLATKLYEAYPNPFNPTTKIDYLVSSPTNINLNIYSIKGQLVDELVNEIQPIGNYSIIWDASKYPSGMYFLKLQTNKKILTQKLMLIK